MKSLIRFVMSAAISLIFVEAAQAGYCYQYLSDPPNTVCGTVEKITALGSVTPPVHYVVQMCLQGAGCWSTTTTTEHDFYQQPVEAYSFLNMNTKIPPDPLNPNPSATFTFNAYSNYEAWGHNNWTLDTRTISTLGLVNYDLFVPPRAIRPATIYPNNGNLSVPDHYFVRWYSGIDADRAPYRATWSVWYKYWPFGGAEPFTFTLSKSGMPCHDDGSGPDKSGNCSTYVAGPQPLGNYKWFVRVHLYVPQGVSTADSPVAFFQEPAAQ